MKEKPTPGSDPEDGHGPGVVTAIGFFGLLGAVFVLGLAANFAGYQNGRRGGIEDGESREQGRAIEAGVGRWVIDPKTGEKHFSYGAGR